MAFTKMKLTTFGSNLEAKARQGKGIHFTRIALGDGLIGNGSLVNRAQLVSERMSIPIDAVLVTDEGVQNAVIGTLENNAMTEGFMYRELALMAKDPDSQQEGIYLYDNAGSECEYLGLPEDGVIISERLKILIRTEGIDKITFEASGNPLYISAEDLAVEIKRHNSSESAHPDKADLDPETRKLIREQLPDMDYAASKHAEQHAADGDDPITPNSIGAADRTHKHTVSQISDFPQTVNPTVHASSHGTSGSDPIAPKDIGAASEGHTHKAEDLPIIPIDKGGTGAKTAAGALAALISGADALTSPASTDLLGLLDISDETGKQITLSSLLTWIKNNGSVQIQTGSYIGTGKYGPNNPNSLTFNFVPRFVVVVSGESAFISSMLGFAWTGQSGSSTSLIFSLQGKILRWYAGDSNTMSKTKVQCDLNGVKYHYAAIG